MMQQARNRQAMYQILRNPFLLSDGMIDETIHRFKSVNPYANGSFNPRNVHDLVRSYLYTLLATMKREAEAKKIRTDVKSLSSFALPEWLK